MEQQEALFPQLSQKITESLKNLQLDTERNPMKFAVQMGYVIYVRLFVEAQERAELKTYFPYAGFPIQWIRGDDPVEPQQRLWQLQYQIQYCSSLVGEEHFMDGAVCADRADWIEELCRLVDLAADQAEWNGKIPEIFGYLLEKTLDQLEQMGNTGMFLIPDSIAELVALLADPEEGTEVWNPGCKTGRLLKALYRKNPSLRMQGTEADRDAVILAGMLSFCYGAGTIRWIRKDPLEEMENNGWDLIVASPPVEELAKEKAERFPVATRRSHLQYLQLVMERLRTRGQALMVMNESTLFKFDAERKIRERLVEEFELQGIVSLPGGALLPCTAAKSSLLIFSKTPKAGTERSAVWFYQMDPEELSGQGAEGFSRILRCWNRRKELEEEWNRKLAAGTVNNKWENPVPAGWGERNCWFADKQTIRGNEYNLTAGRYKPWKEPENTETTESPGELLKKLSQMELEAIKKLQELIEMTKKYE